CSPRPTLFPYTTLFRSEPRRLFSSSTILVHLAPKLLPQDRAFLVSRATVNMHCHRGHVLTPERCSRMVVARGGQSSGGTHILLRSEEHTSELQSRFDLV